jgi:hypothetical protein
MIKLTVLIYFLIIIALPQSKKIEAVLLYGEGKKERYSIQSLATITGRSSRRVGCPSNTPSLIFYSSVVR